MTATSHDRDEARAEGDRRRDIGIRRAAEAVRPHPIVSADRLRTPDALAAKGGRRG